MTDQLIIKNMVCNRCIEAVQEVFDDLEIPLQRINLGQVDLQAPLSERVKNDLSRRLEERGFELLEDKTSQMVARIKSVLIGSVHHRKDRLNINYSSFLEEEIGRDYSFLSSLFSSVTGMTIEQFIIHQKIEKVKELLVYDQLTQSEIAHQLGYSSVQHLSNQFKKITGMTPKAFKKSTGHSRRPIDQINP